MDLRFREVIKIVTVLYFTMDEKLCRNSQKHNEEEELNSFFFTKNLVTKLQQSGIVKSFFYLTFLFYLLIYFEKFQRI